MGNYVPIALNATILKGVIIGDGAIVAAGALAVHDVPTIAMVGGVPTQALREYVKWKI